MPETARYTALVANNADQAASDMSKVLQVEIREDLEKVAKVVERRSRTQSYGLFSKQFLKKHGLHLLGTAMCWFLLDIAFYSNNLFQKDIFSAVGWLPKPRKMSALQEVYMVAKAQTLVSFFGTLPGYWFNVGLIDIIGRFYIQLMGFAFITFFMFALAIPYHHWTTPGNHIWFVVMYALTFFFANFGPNATTFVVPAEIFPARLRSTCHGISAAAGKIGAMISAFGFLYLAQPKDASKTDAGYPPGIGVRNSLMILAGTCALGFFFTFLVPEAKGKSLEEMSGENEDEAQDYQVSANHDNITVPV